MLCLLLLTLAARNSGSGTGSGRGWTRFPCHSTSVRRLLSHTHTHACYGCHSSSRSSASFLPVDQSRALFAAKSKTCALLHENPCVFRPITSTSDRRSSAAAVGRNASFLCIADVSSVTLRHEAGDRLRDTSVVGDGFDPSDVIARQAVLSGTGQDNVLVGE